MTTFRALLIGGALTSAPALLDAQVQVPWGVGERAVYDVRFGPMKVGQGSMEVEGIEEVRGRKAWHTTFRVRGGTFFYKVNDLNESWFDTRTLHSLRFTQDLQEGRRDRERHFEIFPERQVYQEDGGPEQQSVREPLDDGAFLYFIRIVGLQVGQTYDFDRYFRADRNPVRIRVLRRERVTVPAGTFDAVVIQPIIKARGIFSENGQAEIWLSDDDRRVMLQMKSRLSFGSLNLFLRSYTPGTPAAATTGSR